MARTCRVQSFELVIQGCLVHDTLPAELAQRTFARLTSY